MSPTSYQAALFRVRYFLTFYGWGRGIRTPECQYQKLMPYRLAIPQKMLHIVCVDGIIGQLEDNVKGLRFFLLKKMYNVINFRKRNR